MVGGTAIFITISSLELEQAPLPIVQRKVAVLPATSPLTDEVGELLLMVAVPDTTDHEPVPITGVLAAKVVVVTLHKL